MRADEITLKSIEVGLREYLVGLDLELEEGLTIRDRALRISKKLHCARLTPSVTKQSANTCNSTEQVPLTWWDHFKATRGWKYKTRSIATDTTIHTSLSIDMLLPFNVSMPRPGQKPRLCISADDPWRGPVADMFRAPEDDVIPKAGGSER